jgi:hypothetical protein
MSGIFANLGVERERIRGRAALAVTPRLSLR